MAYLKKEVASSRPLVLSGLNNCNKNDLVGAFDHMPKNSRLLYLHAYQSLVWNKAVSERLRTFGERVLIGDLVLLPDKSGKPVQSAPDDFQQIEPVEDREEEGKEGTEDLAKSEELGEAEKAEEVKVGDEVKIGEEVKAKEKGPQKEPVKKYQLLEERIVTVTEANISDFSILDVLMPVPGWRVRYPENEDLKRIYDEILRSDGLENGFESLRHRVDFYSLPGAYRNVVVKPWNFSFRFMEYNDPNQDLLLSDLDILRGWQLREPKSKVRQSFVAFKF